MQLTQEQQTIIQTISNKDCNFVKINAVSGSGKTSSLIAIAEHLNVKNGLYISYNKAIAKEASEKFGSLIDCRTIHSLAYGFTVKHFNLKLVPTLKPRIITERIDYIRKSHLVDILNKYFLSRHVTIQGYLEEFYPKSHPDELTMLKKYFVKMKEGQCDCSHDFYLKLFHILLHHKIVTTQDYDLLMLDEAGDVNGASLEIFRLIKAKKKVMVGDNQQNIYSFNQTINGFEALKDEGASLGLSQSFRVSSHIAPYVEEFCHQYLDSSMVFKGVDYKKLPTSDTSTQFYIARTNAGVVEQMIELEERHLRYNLTRPVKTLFAVPLMLMRINKSPEDEIYNVEYKFLEEDLREYVRSEAIKNEYKSPLSYIAYMHSDDQSIMAGINLLRRIEPRIIMSVYNKALEHEKHHETHRITVTSGHSAKGLESDVVYILDDMNAALDKIIVNQHERIDNIIQNDRARLGDDWVYDPIKYEFFSKENPNMDLLSRSEVEEFRLYYVAVTRAKFQINNAQWLSEPDIYTNIEESTILNRGSFEWHFFH